MRQPMPTPGEHLVFPEVINDLEGRMKQGVETYGTPLETNNGRDALLDAYHEALDLAVYLKQALMEREDD